MSSQESPWKCLHERIAREVFRAPSTVYASYDTTLLPETIEPLRRTLGRLSISPWIEPLALAAGVCAIRHYRITDVIQAVRLVDKGFRMNTWNFPAAEEWTAHDCLRACMEEVPSSGRIWRAHAIFLGSYVQLAYELRRWYMALPKDIQVVYATFVTPFTPFTVEITLLNYMYSWLSLIDDST